MANYKDQWTHCLLQTEPVGLWEGLCFGCFKLFSLEEWGNNAAQVPVGTRNRIRLQHRRQMLYRQKNQKFQRFLRFRFLLTVFSCPVLHTSLINFRFLLYMKYNNESECPMFVCKGDASQNPLPIAQRLQWLIEKSFLSPTQHTLNQKLPLFQVDL